MEKQEAGGRRQEAGTAQRWEYDTLLLGATNGFVNVERVAREGLARMGNEGWELVQVFNGQGIFKRPLADVGARSVSERPPQAANANDYNGVVSVGGLVSEMSAGSPVDEIMRALVSNSGGAVGSDSPIVMNSRDCKVFRGVVEGILAKRDRVIAGGLHDVNVLAQLVAQRADPTLLPWRVHPIGRGEEVIATFAERWVAESFINLSRKRDELTVTGPIEPAPTKDVFFPKTTSVATMPVPASREDEAAANRFPKPQAPSPKPRPRTVQDDYEDECQKRLDELNTQHE